MVQVEPVERDPDQPSTDNVPDQGSQNVPIQRTRQQPDQLLDHGRGTFLGRQTGHSLPDVDGHRGTLVQHHTQGDDEHVGDDVLELGDDYPGRPMSAPLPPLSKLKTSRRLTESGQDEIDPKDLSYEVTAHLGDEYGEADHDVTPDTPQKDLVPFQGPSGSGGVGNERLYGP